ncbi:MAG: hypothetical protein QG650_89 [Patescibacteria group bacterium]|nr:hypothetical protein [Patescibacteria group bacterium]
MLGYTVSLAFRGLSTYRWNNFPRVEQVTATDNVAFSLHVAHLVALSYEAETGTKVDIGYLYRRALFSSFSTFLHSDISNEVKQHVKTKNPAIYQKLSDVAYDRLLAWDLPDFVRKDVETYRRPNSEKILEEKIYQFSKNWVSYQEAFTSNFVYFRSFERPMSDIRERYLSSEYAELRKYLALDPVDHAESELYLLAIRRLQSSFRWNHMRRTHPVSVMSHLFFIFYISYLIGNAEGLSEDAVTDIMTTALYHDIPEAITGDVITPTKKSVPGFEDLLAEIEEEMVEEYLIEHIRNQPFAAELKKRMLHPWDCDNGNLVKLADVFSALFEAKIEAANSEEFAHVYRKIRKNLHKFENPSVAYLFRHAVDPFEENLEDILK